MTIQLNYLDKLYNLYSKHKKHVRGTSKKFMK